MQFRTTLNTISLATLLAFAGTAAAADSHCMDNVGTRDARTPDTDFVVLGGGVVEHKPTKLQWTQCALGQNPGANGCEGQAQVFYWNEAKDAVEQVNDNGGMGGYNDWRLPTLDEMLTIVEKCRETPAINTEVFPDTPWTGFWTATLHRDADDEHETDHVDNPAYRGAHPEDEDREEDARRKKETTPEAWFVGFHKGMEYPYDINSSYRVRLVRSAN